MYMFIFMDTHIYIYNKWVPGQTPTSSQVGGGEDGIVPAERGASSEIFHQLGFFGVFRGSFTANVAIFHQNGKDLPEPAWVGGQKDHGGGALRKAFPDHTRKDPVVWKGGGGVLTIIFGWNLYWDIQVTNCFRVSIHLSPCVGIFQIQWYTFFEEKFRMTHYYSRVNPHEIWSDVYWYFSNHVQFLSMEK